MYQPYTKAPFDLHRLCTDLRSYPLSVQTTDDVEAWNVSHRRDVRDVVVKERDGKLYAVKHGLPAAYIDCNNGLKKAGGPSLLGVLASENTLRAAHDLKRNGRQLTCLVYKAEAAAPDKTAFVHDKYNLRHCMCVPMEEELELQSLQSVANPRDASDKVWQACPFGGGENPLQYKQPPNPSDVRLCEVSAALEDFALNEEQNPMLRMAARLYRYSICEEDSANDQDWGDLANANLEMLNLLRLAQELTQEPSDINRLLAFRVVREEVNDQTQTISV